MMPRRQWLKSTLSAAAAVGVSRGGRVLPAPAAIQLPAGVPTDTFDFETRGIEGWTTVGGQWAVEAMTGAPSGARALVQHATKSEFNVIVAPGSRADLDVSVKFKPISGRQDASGGIVFRFRDGKYYVVRANALEDNFRLYFHDRGRHQLASARVRAPGLGQWHTLRVVAVGDHVQAYLGGTLYLDHRDSRFKTGGVGLWTKADAISAFDDLTIQGTTGGA